MDIETVAAERDTAYRERAQLVALLAAIYPAAIAPAPDFEGWSIVYVDLPTGQASWHISVADLELFEHVAKRTHVAWDGHSTEEKYRRIARLAVDLRRG